MFKFHELKFCYDLINKHLPPYFTTMDVRSQQVTYYQNTRQRRHFKAIRVKHVFAERCIRYCIPEILNKTDDLIIDKIKTHSPRGFSTYIKQFYLNKYNTICLIPNCYICGR